MKETCINSSLRFAVLVAQKPYFSQIYALETLLCSNVNYHEVL